MNDQNDMQAMSAQAGRLIDSLARAILTTAETAAEKIELAAHLAKLEQRAAAYDAALEALDAQVQALEARMHDATPARKALYARQVEMLLLQQEAVLVKMGLPQTVARKALAIAKDTDRDPQPRDDQGRFARKGESA